MLEHHNLCSKLVSRGSFEHRLSLCLDSYTLPYFWLKDNGQFCDKIYL